MKKFIFLSLFAALAGNIFSQSPYVPLNIQSAMTNGTRTASGAPGAKYWQNSGDYDIQIKFTPATGYLEGTEKITYYNNSPDTLNALVVQLFADYYKKGVARWYAVDPMDENNGVKITKCVVNGEAIEISDDVADHYEYDYYREGTNLTLTKNKYAPHSSIQIEFAWHYYVNKGSANRTGLVDPGSYFLAYTFPRIAVYDDIDGWNTHSYNGLQEFYNDFGKFNVAITVPKNFVVWATGDLINPQEVFQPAIIQKIDDVMHSDSVQFVIDKATASAKKVTQQNKWNTFKFKAENVNDFAFALSDHYVWQSSSLNVSLGTKTKERRVRVDAVYNPAHTDYEKVAGIAHQSIALMSTKFPAVPYPYAHETVFDGLDQMEYPMMVNDNPVDDSRPDAELYTIELTSHEIFHTYFPFYMGVNETKYAWMDEGWATLGEYFIAMWIMNNPQHKVFMVDYYNGVAGSDLDLPMNTLSTQLNEDSYWENSYPKPALMYLYAKEILGDEKFFNGLHHYMETWQGKHPTPYDFFNCMNTGSGVNLNWYWNAWCFTPGYADVAVMNVIDNGNNNYTAIVANRGNKPVPVDLTVNFSDGTNKWMHANAGVWEGNNIYYFKFTSTVKPVKAVLGKLNIPDANISNNEWESK